MLRTEACISFMLLVALRSSEGFATTQQRPRFATATTTTASSAHSQQQQQQLQRRLSLKRPLSTSSSTAASLYGAQFRAADASSGVNNRHSSNDYWYNIKTMPQSAILRDIRNPVLAVFGWSTAVSMVHFVLSRSSNNLLATMASKMCVSSAAHSFLVSALGLLLVFRTNSAYQRFYVSFI